MANAKRKCKCCGVYFNANQEGAVKINRGWFLNMDHVLIFTKAKQVKALFRAQNKAKKEKKSLNARLKREFYANDKPFRMKRAQIAFNAYIRKRDEFLSCISCDKPSNWQGQWHCSHYKTVGSRGDIRFNEDNAHKGCSVCNNHLSGNIGEYTPRLIVKIGQDRVDALEVVQIRKYSCDELLGIEAEYKVKLKELML